jgi:hypothetical protein
LQAAIGHEVSVYQADGLAARFTLALRESIAAVPEQKPRNLLAKPVPIQHRTAHDGASGRE